MALRQHDPSAPWAFELEKIVRRILDRAFRNPQFAFDTPVIVPGEKNPAKHQYRPIAQYSLEDKVIDCLVARYLRETLDSVLSQSSMAFRCGKPGQPPPTIHDALARLLRLNRRHRKTGLYVAECDIGGFYDCVAHDVAETAIDQLIRDLSRTNQTLSIHPRALVIFGAYLRSYAFSEDADKGQGAASLKAKDADGEYTWPRAHLQELHGRPQTLPRIGVPQGGALSCLIANAVLHRADVELGLLQRRRRRSINYLRYCDDMILLCRDRVVCEEAFSVYRRVVTGLKLPIHEPKPIPVRNTQRKRPLFYTQKSNEPYLWSASEKGGHPWIQFVGYQIRYDGLVRIRLKSVKKELSKLRRTADDLIHRLSFKSAKPIRCTAQQILHRFRMKLISMAVGRASLGYVVSPELPMCWAHGFRGLRSCQFIESALKQLDRYREQQIGRVKTRLNALPLPTKSASPNEGHRVLPFYGRPFSYWGQFRR